MNPVATEPAAPNVSNDVSNGAGSHRTGTNWREQKSQVDRPQWLAVNCDEHLDHVWQSGGSRVRVPSPPLRCRNDNGVAFQQPFRRWVGEFEGFARAPDVARLPFGLDLGTSSASATRLQEALCRPAVGRHDSGAPRQYETNRDGQASLGLTPVDHRPGNAEGPPIITPADRRMYRSPRCRPDRGRSHRSEQPVWLRWSANNRPYAERP